MVDIYLTGRTICSYQFVEVKIAQDVGAFLKKNVKK